MDCGIYISQVGRTNEDSKSKPKISVSFNGERLLSSPSQKSSVNLTCYQIFGGSSCCAFMPEAQSWQLVLTNCPAGVVVRSSLIRGSSYCGAHFLLSCTLCLFPLNKHCSGQGMRLVDILRTSGHSASTVEVFLLSIVMEYKQSYFRVISVDSFYLYVFTGCPSHQSSKLASFRSLSIRPPSLSQSRSWTYCLSSVAGKELLLYCLFRDNPQNGYNTVIVHL